MLRFLIISILFCFGLSGNCQIDLDNYAINRHGLTIDEPFHSGFGMYEDSLGHLVAYMNLKKNVMLTFDGTSFAKEVVAGKNEMYLGNVNDDIEWFIKDAFLLHFKKGAESDTLDVRKYVKRNISFLKRHNNFYYLFSNDGFIKFDIINGKINVIDSYAYEVDRFIDAFFINDTLFLDSHRDPEYALLSDPSNLISFQNPGVNNNDLFQLTNRRILVQSNKGLVMLGAESSTYQFLTTQKKSIVKTYLDNANRIWCGLRNQKFHGTYVLEEGSDTPREIKLGKAKSSYVNFYEDRLGDMWIGTSGEGIFHLYNPIANVQNREVGLVSDNVYSIAVSSKNNRSYYSMGCSGIDVLENNKVVDHILGRNCQRSILIDRNDRLWLTSNGVKLYVPGSPVVNFDKSKGLHSRTVPSLFEDSQGDIWAGTRQVLHKYQNGKFIKFQIPDLDIYDRIFNIVELENGELLLAISDDSFYRFDGFRFYKVDSPEVNSMQLFKDLEERIWLATEGQGLYLYKEGKFEPLKGSSSIFNSIYFLQDSPNGLMFGMTDNNTIFYADKEGLIHQENPNVNVLSIDDGLPLIDLNARIQPSTALFDDGHIVFPNIYGAIKINTEAILENKNNFLSSITHQDSIVNSGNIILPLGEDDITLRIDNLYLNPQSSIINEYAVNDAAFSPIEEGNQINIKHLKAGDNRIRFRARHTAGDWMPSIDVIVNRKHLLYERWWFQLGMLLLFIGIMYLLVKWRTGIVKAQNILLESKVKEQTLALEREKIQLAESLEAQKVLTTELNITQASKNRMYAQISHEFKSPLQAINAHLSKGENTILQVDKTRIKSNIQNLLDISNEIMELSKAESGALKVKKKYYNINGVINDQIELKMPLAEKKNVSIIHDAKNDPQYLEFDISLIQKVMNNLLSNAIKFSPEGGSITIKSSINTNSHLIEVADNGPGIPKEEIENLTMAYYQASNNSKDGTGIGLSLVEKILKLHGSKLNIKSRLGTGSTFSFELVRPTISQSQIVEENIGAIPIGSQMEKIVDTSKPILMAVDDSVDVLYFISQSLSSKYNVITASNGKEALESIDAVDPVAIVSDYNMPIMNGMELLKKIRKKPKYKSLPFLILTGSSSEETEMQSIIAGADLILQKPIQEELLITKVGQLLDRQRSISESIKTGFAHDLLPTNIHNDDLIIMQQLEAVFLEHIDNGKLKSEEIASMVGLGEKTLRNRVKSITGLTIKEYFRNYRLEKAKLLLEEGYGTMGEVASATGFSSLSYFSKSYKKYFSGKELMS